MLIHYYFHHETANEKFNVQIFSPYLANEKYFIAGILNLSNEQLMNLNCRERLVTYIQRKNHLYLINLF